jgi:small multidrug resistance pump
MSWLFLVIAICLEVGGTTFMKLSQGFSRTLFTVLTFACYGLSFIFLSLTLRRLEIGVTYAIWSGLGTALIAVIGFIWFKETVTVTKVISMALIIIGVIGLNLSTTAP